MLCVGETLEEREAGKAKEKIVSQIKADFAELEKDLAEKVVIAYEPIWAIGTGKTASSEDANEACKWVRDEIRNLYGDEVAENIEILYGGSVKSSNAKELFAMSDIDGGLVGGASLEPEEFSKIANYNK
jgi:triosephosphate isomerase